MSFQVVWLIILINVYIGNARHYISCGDIIPISGGEHIIICDNNCNECNIECNSDNCKNSRIYSGALNTNIYCNGVSSCDESKFKIGYNYGGYPNNYDETNFIKDEYNIFRLNCNAGKSCYNADIYVNGNISNGININVNGNGDDILKNAVINVNILNGVLLCYLQIYHTISYIYIELI